MKKIILLSLIYLLCILYTKSQNNVEYIVLEKYSIPLNSKGAKISKVLASEKEEITLSKDTANIFMVDGEGTIYLKDNKELTSDSPFRYEITIKSGEKEKSFELVSDGFIKNKVIAHRGAWKHHEVHQNSLGALKKATELGCEASEFDVWLTKDNRIALNHDRDINGLIIEETDLAEMQKIILESNEVIPTLEEYINCIKRQNKTRLVLEIKSNTENNRSTALTDSVVNIIHRMKAQAWVDYISFDYNALLKLRSLDPSANISYLDADRPMDLQKVEGMTGIDYNFSQLDKIERLYDRARVLGFTINFWTVNDEILMKRLLDMDVDYITTDEPELLLKLIKNRN